MRHDPARTARRALLGLVVVVSLAVAWSLRRSKPPEPSPRPQATPGAGTTLGDVSFLRFKDDRRGVQVKAREAVSQAGDTMQLRGVEATLPFVNAGRPSNLVVRAEECQYQPKLERAAFKGKVELRTDDGFELDTDTLKYWGDQQRAFTNDPVRFKRGAMSGSSVGLEYRSNEGILLKSGSRIRIEDPGGSPLEIESTYATGSREEHVLEFKAGVHAQQGTRELRSENLRLDMNDAFDTVEKATATGNVDLLIGPGAALPGGAAASGGGKRLRGQRLEVQFRDKGVLQQATATDAASLEIEPGPQEAQERRRIAAPRLRFDFDESGAPVAVHASGASEPASRTRGQAGRLTVLTAEPMVAGQGTPRRVESETLDAVLDAATGAPQSADFKGAVAFSEPGRKAFASEAVHDEAKGTLLLTGDPRIVDEGEGSELRAPTIRIGTRTRAVSAGGGVKHTLARRSRSAGSSAGGAPDASGTARLGFFGGEEPTVFVCREFEYDPATRTAHYRENAMARSGTDEIRAPLITLEDQGPGHRRMTATGGTTSLLHPKPSKDQAKDPAKDPAKPPAPVDARSEEMVYEEAASKVVYTGGVEIRQGDIVTKSPVATALLSKDGNTLDKLLADDGVEVRQGQRRANGEHGVYTPGNETFVLTGEKVQLFDGDRKLFGRILTFVSGSDRIRVDGREEERTEAVFKRKELPRP